MKKTQKDSYTPGDVFLVEKKEQPFFFFTYRLSSDRFIDLLTKKEVPGPFSRKWALADANVEIPDEVLKALKHSEITTNGATLLDSAKRLAVREKYQSEKLAEYREAAADHVEYTAGLEGEISRLRNYRDLNSRSIEDHTKVINRLREEITNLQRSYSTLVQKRGSLEKELTEVSQTRDRLTTQNAELHGVLAGRDSVLVRLNDQVTGLKKENEDLTKSLKDFYEENLRVGGENQNLRRRVNELSCSAFKLFQENQKLTQKCPEAAPTDQPHGPQPPEEVQEKSSIGRIAAELSESWRDFDTVKEAEPAPSHVSDLELTEEEIELMKRIRRIQGRPQVGGDHYQQHPIQPVTYCTINGFPFCESSAIKYISRHASVAPRKARESLEKAINFLQRIISDRYSEFENERPN